MDPSDHLDADIADHNDPGGFNLWNNYSNAVAKDVIQLKVAKFKQKYVIWQKMLFLVASSYNF